MGVISEEQYIQFLDDKNQLPKIQFYINGKMLPQWAMDLRKVRDICIRQKKNNLAKISFGVLRAIRDLDMNAIFDTDEDVPRGPSA